MGARTLQARIAFDHPENRDETCALGLVPTARLELAQLSPLPPQDSVSTNFTTSAALEFFASAGMRNGSPGNREF